MDAVITYVDGRDPLWQKEFAQWAGAPIVEKRYRDWDTLRFLFRALEKNMPFLRRVFLIVSGPSQVPAWISDKVRIVYHNEIIPEDQLPTFNSRTIEMFLHRIPDLDEQFLYFNDDMFPLLPCEAEDFFDGDRIRTGFTTHLLITGSYKSLIRDCDRFARKALGQKAGISFIRPQHTVSPMLKSVCKELCERFPEQIRYSLTRVRQKGNLGQYVFTLYAYFSGRAIRDRLSSKHLPLASINAAALQSYLSSPTEKLVCLNDGKLDETRAEAVRAVISRCFEKLFPDKSVYER